MSLVNHRIDDQNELISERSVDKKLMDLVLFPIIKVKILQNIDWANSFFAIYKVTFPNQPTNCSSSHFKVSQLLVYKNRYDCCEFLLGSTSSGTTCNDAVAKDYACKILALHNSGKIHLWNRHPSGVHDNAYAYNNIRDACNGHAASRSQ